MEILLQKDDQHLGWVRSRRAAAPASWVPLLLPDLGEGHSARPREPALTTKRQPLPAWPGPAEQRSRHPRPRPPQQRLPPSPPQRRPPASWAAGGSHACRDWLTDARPDDVSAPLIGGLWLAAHRGRCGLELRWSRRRVEAGV